LSKVPCSSDKLACGSERRCSPSTFCEITCATCPARCRPAMAMCVSVGSACSKPTAGAPGAAASASLAAPAPAAASFRVLRLSRHGSEGVVGGGWTGVDARATRERLTPVALACSVPPHAAI